MHLNPAIEAFLETGKLPLSIGQIVISDRGKGFDLRHRIDENLPEKSLRFCDANALRKVAASDSKGAFRPLKSAATLQNGWRSFAANQGELWHQINIIYPGALGDWFALKSAVVQPVSFRKLVARQTGIYRNASMISDEEAGKITQSCCAKHCLKKQKWTISSEKDHAKVCTKDHAKDRAKDRASLNASSLICLEPCQVFLEFARRVAKMKKEGMIMLKLPRSEVKGLLEILENHQDQTENFPSVRFADLSSLKNPMRIDLLIQRIRSQIDP